MRCRSVPGSAGARHDHAGKLMFQITGAFAEFERSMIRVNAGLKRAIHGKANPEPIAGRQGHAQNCG